MKSPELIIVVWLTRVSKKKLHQNLKPKKWKERVHWLQMILMSKIISPYLSIIPSLFTSYRLERILAMREMNNSHAFFTSQHHWFIQKWDMWCWFRLILRKLLSWPLVTDPVVVVVYFYLGNWNFVSECKTCLFTRVCDNHRDISHHSMVCVVIMDGWRSVPQWHKIKNDRIRIIKKIIFCLVSLTLWGRKGIRMGLVYSLLFT